MHYFLEASDGFACSWQPVLLLLYLSKAEQHEDEVAHAHWCAVCDQFTGAEDYSPLHACCSGVYTAYYYHIFSSILKTEVCRGHAK